MARVRQHAALVSLHAIVRPGPALLMHRKTQPVPCVCERRRGCLGWGRSPRSLNWAAACSWMKLASVPASSRSYKISLPTIRSNRPTSGASLASVSTGRPSSRSAARAPTAHAGRAWAAEPLRRVFSSKKARASGWQSLAVTKAPPAVRHQTGQAQAATDFQNALARDGRRAMRSAKRMPEGHSMPNKGHVADEMPKFKASSKGSWNWLFVEQGADEQVVHALNRDAFLFGQVAG
jgi:hypothetical protein